MASGDRTGECDEADARIFDHFGHLIVVNVQELKDAFRLAGCLERFGVAFGDERRLRRDL